MNQHSDLPRHPYYDEKVAERENRVKNLFDSLDTNNTGYLDADAIIRGFLKLTHLPTHTSYATDLLAKCNTSRDGLIDYEEFRAYVLEKERELWGLFAEINKSNDHRLRACDLKSALKAAGVCVTQDDIEQFIQAIDTDLQQPQDIDINHIVICLEGNGYIDFQDWRDFLLLLPQDTTIIEIYKYYQTSTQLTPDAEVVFPHTDEAVGNAYKYLAAGGIAGAVSRTCTAPLDRLKVYLITQTSYQAQAKAPMSITGALKHIYSQGGVRAFFVGNGLNVIKIVPESAIKFYVFETAKSIMAELTNSEDKNGIPVSARFIAGGVAGLCSQFCIYPVETLKTRIMANHGGSPVAIPNPHMACGSAKPQSYIFLTAKEMYKTKGIRAFWPGLTLGLLGVFPYQALDMGIYETLKVTYLQHMNTQASEHRQPGEPPQPNVLVLWTCGMVSGSIGATSVYPLNMIRTRLQAQGTAGHPHRYNSAFDAVKKTFKADGIKGFYKGLGPTLFKVVPSVSISYAVYEFSKRSLGIS